MRKQRKVLKCINYVKKGTTYSNLYQQLISSRTGWFYHSVSLMILSSFHMGYNMLQPLPWWSLRSGKKHVRWIQIAGMNLTKLFGIILVECWTCVYFRCNIFLKSCSCQHPFVLFCAWCGCSGPGNLSTHCCSHATSHSDTTRPQGTSIISYSWAFVEQISWKTVYFRTKISYSRTPRQEWNTTICNNFT